MILQTLYWIIAVGLSIFILKVLISFLVRRKLKELKKQLKKELKVKESEIEKLKKELEIWKFEIERLSKELENELGSASLLYSYLKREEMELEGDHYSDSGHYMLKDELASKRKPKELEDIFTKPHDVSLGAAAPRIVKPKEEFTARFIAYHESFEREIEKKLIELSPRMRFYTGLQKCSWQTGTEVKIVCYGNQLKVRPFESKFKWRGGGYNIVDFDVIVSVGAKDKTILKFDVLIDDIVIARLRMDIKIGKIKSTEILNTVKARPYKTAFASYASEDKLRVLDRVSEIQRNGVNIFLDCLSLNPGEKWKTRLESEIKDRQIFLLFWSINAKKSKWVDWEWRTAFKHKGISGIDPHPLDPVSEAKPPKELKSLHFGDPYVLVRKAYEKKEMTFGKTPVSE